MPNSVAKLEVDWTTALRSRRSTMSQRIGSGLAMAMITGPVLGEAFGVGWALAFLVGQLAEWLVFRPLLRQPDSGMGFFRSAGGYAILVVNAALFGLPMIPMWLSGGPMGGLTATVILAAGVLYSTINAICSVRVLICTLAPQALFLAATPIMMATQGAPHHLVVAAAAALVLFIMCCLVTWQKNSAQSRQAIETRQVADRRGKAAEIEAARRSAHLAAVAHDLRTPIGAILTGAAELDRGATDSAARAQSALITDAGLMMKALLDDLLDHSRLEAGRMTVEAADFNLRMLLAQTLRLWAGPIKAKGLSLRVEGSHEAPAMVRGDAMRLRQVLNNLISNAVKFTDEGSITLRLRSWVEDPYGHALLIEVADTGPGMRPDQLARLFTPFDQTEEGVSARHGGSGLGLSISRNLVQLMGGRLVARSEPGVGARFTVSVVFPPAVDSTVRPTGLEAQSRADVAVALHRTPDEPARAAVPAPAQQPAPIGVVEQQDTAVDPMAAQAETNDDDRPLRVLIVDDHDINRRAVELILSPLGCDIVSAADGMAALAHCQAQAFDVVFMDVRMPELDGRETTRRLRAQPGPNVAVPVIAVTADTAEDDIAACMAAGMDYFVSKPLTPAALLTALEHVLNGADAGSAEDSEAA